MAKIHRGVVRGNAVMLPEGTDLPDGAIAEVRLLPDTEQDQDLVAAEEAFKQQLVAAGLMREIRRPPRAHAPGDRTPIRVKGTPVSEIVLDERR